MDEQHCLALAAGNADVSLTGLAGAVDDTAHNSHFDGLFAALESALHLICDFGAGVLGAAAGGAGDDLGASHGEAHGAQDVVACFHFLLGLGGQRDADGIADALQQHPADAHAALEQTHLVSTGLGHAHMQGVIGHGAQLAVGLHHAGHVGVLDGDDDVVEIELLQQADMVQGAFHHGLGHRCAVLCQDVLFQAAAVHTDADGDVLLLAGLQVIDRGLYESSAIDGAGPVVTFFKITLPLVKPSLLVALLFRTLDAFRVYDLIAILTGGGPGNGTESLSIYAYKLMFDQSNYGYSSVVVMGMFVVVAIIAFLYSKKYVGARCQWVND